MRSDGHEVKIDKTYEPDRVTSMKFVDFIFKGKHYRAWDEGADCVSVERYGKWPDTGRRPVGYPNEQLLKAAQDALATFKTEPSPTPANPS